MKKPQRFSSILILLFILNSILSFAQSNGFKVFENTRQLQERLLENAEETNTISTDFIQEKEMSLLAEKIISKGMFLFKKEDKIRIEYLTPFNYILVMSGGQITIKDDQKTNKVNTRNSKTMQSVNQLMMDCMRGTVFQNKDFSVKSFENNKAYLMILKPVEESMKKMFLEIHVYIEKSNYAVSQLIMKENNGDQTVMKFANVKINPNLSDALFNIR